MQIGSFVIIGEGFMFTDCTGLDKTNHHQDDKMYLDIHRASIKEPIKHLLYSERFINFVLFIAQNVIFAGYTNLLDLRDLQNKYKRLYENHDITKKYCKKFEIEYTEKSTRVDLGISGLYITISENYAIHIKGLRNK